MTVHPSAQTSAAGPCSSPRTTSGAMNAGVPLIGPLEPTRLAHPKSASLARPSAPITTFLALTSPCTTDSSPWRYAMPRATSAAYARTAASARRPPFLPTSSASEPPGANSRSSWNSPPAAARKPRQGSTCGERRAAMIPPSRRSCAAPAAPAADLTARSSPSSPAAKSDTTAPDAPRPSVRSRVRRRPPLPASVAISVELVIPHWISFRFRWGACA
ncbi:hypothetical protein PVAP13_3NG258003 [Panicum virgatum]|uniref:Uncharacterized protein n=1 Tax=Panicum virgatum TaxID=38727 RepID=A0A8T0TZY9_PANVG|nr:hypothetical protein PVAP13_3NG258003 [Panicum virgatum]